MTHERFRQVNDLYRKLAAASPIIGIFGHRQVGKSTLAEQLSSNYVTFDDKKERLAALEDAAKFLRALSKPRSHAPAAPVVIDECQLVPELFPALKEYVRKSKRPGQFLLTGSVRFTSRKAIRESLAGRILTLELYPLVLSELTQKPLPDILPQLLNARIFDTNTLSWFPRLAEQRQTSKAFEVYLKQGGLPGLCFLRSDRLRAESLQAIHSLILDRDLRLITETRLSHETLGEYLAHIASLGSNPYVFADVTRKIGISIPTQKSLLFALEAIFLIRRIRLEGKKGFLLLMEDQFEEFALSANQHPRETQILTAFYRNARAQFNYRLGLVNHWSSYWLNSGAHVPLVLHAEAKQLGFLALSGDTPTLSQSRSALRFLRQYPNGKIVYLNEIPGSAQLLDDRTMICSVGALL